MVKTTLGVELKARERVKTTLENKKPLLYKTGAADKSKSGTANDAPHKPATLDKKPVAGDNRALRGKRVLSRLSNNTKSIDGKLKRSGNRIYRTVRTRLRFACVTEHGKGLAGRF